MAHTWRRTPTEYRLALDDGTPVHVDEILGRGAYGNVHKGYAGFRTVAVKFFRHVQGVTEAYEREAAVCRVLDHPHIVRMLADGETKDESGDAALKYLVFEYAGSRTMRHVFETSQTRPSMAEKERVMVSLVRAVRYLHARDICHHDLKPENIIVAESGHVAIADFGLASFHGSPMTREGKGTLLYAGPESFDPSIGMGFGSDVWSLGVIFYELLANGQMPFTGRNEMTLKSDIQRAQPPPLPATVPAKWRTAVERMLVRSPFERISADELYELVIGPTRTANSSQRVSFSNPPTTSIINLPPVSPGRSSDEDDMVVVTGFSSAPRPPAAAARSVPPSSSVGAALLTAKGSTPAPSSASAAAAAAAAAAAGPSADTNSATGRVFLRKRAMEGDEEENPHGSWRRRVEPVAAPSGSKGGRVSTHT